MPFTWENGVASFTVTNIDVHAVVVIEE